MSGRLWGSPSHPVLQRGQGSTEQKWSSGDWVVVYDCVKYCEKKMQLILNEYKLLTISDANSHRWKAKISFSVFLCVAINHDQHDMISPRTIKNSRAHLNAPCIAIHGRRFRRQHRFHQSRLEGACSTTTTTTRMGQWRRLRRKQRGQQREQRRIRISWWCCLLLYYCLFDTNIVKVGCYSNPCPMLQQEHQQEDPMKYKIHERSLAYYFWEPSKIKSFIVVLLDDVTRM